MDDVNCRRTRYHRHADAASANRVFMDAQGVEKRRRYFPAEAEPSLRP